MEKNDNELIAEFMGIVFWKQIKNERYYKVPKEHVYANNAGLGQFRYDTSWDWLMPVVEKIESLHSVVPGHLLQIEITRGFVKILGTPGQHIFYNISIEGSKIQATYRAVVDFIKWYNSKT